MQNRLEHFLPGKIFKVCTYFSLSPSHLDMRSEEETEKKVELLASVATAFARYDFPVPGGPNSRIPLQGVRLPEDTAMYNERNCAILLCSVY